VRVALSTIDRTPAVFDAMTAGLLDLTKAKIIATELGNATDDHARQVVARLLPEVERCTTAQIREKIRRLLLKLDPDAVRKRHQKALESRAVEHAEYSNGTAALSGICLPKDKAAAAFDHITAIATATRSAGGDARSLDQIRADVFADLLAGVDPALSGAATPATRKGVVNLHIGLTTLAGLDDYPGEIEGFGPLIADIARDTAAQLAETAQWRFVVHDDNGEAVAEGPLRHRPPTPNSGESPANEPPPGKAAAGQSAAGDRVGYRPTARQKAYVIARDRTCRAPGCRRPARACDLDHIRDWADSHETTILNLTALCRRHHRAKHKGGFRVQRTLFGIDWVTPRGRRYTVIPEFASAPGEVEFSLSQWIHGFHSPSQLRR
jgi:hypothetical protein